MIVEIVKYLFIGTILLCIFNIISKIYGKFKEFLKKKQQEKKLIKLTKKKIEKKEKKEKEIYIEKFFGLFELDIQNCEEAETIKKECSSIIKDKILAKYSLLKINSTDKIFFNSRDFSNLSNIINDFVKLFSYIADINKKRKITTRLKLSIWAKEGHTNLQEAYRVLNEINNLGFLNQVMSNEVIYKQYMKLNLNGLNFHPHGVIRLIENDEDVELYRLLKSSIS